MENKTKIIYVVGAGRSGSTLLDILLGAQENVRSTGELVNMCNSHIRGEYCSCGTNVSNCKFWNEVVSSWKEMNDLNEAEVEKFAELEIYYSHPKNLKVWLAALGVYKSQEYSNYLMLLKSLVTTYQRLAQSKIICDSSKSPVRLLHLHNIFGGEIFAIHLIKDPVNVIASLKKMHSMDPSRGLQADIAARKPLRTAIWWIAINVMTSFSLLTTKTNFVRISFEELISDPNTSLSKICKNFVYTPPIIPEHICAGNRMRMEKRIFIRKNNSSKQNEKLGALTGLVLYLFRRYYI